MDLQIILICVTIKIDFSNQNISYQSSQQPLFHLLLAGFFYILENLKGHQGRPPTPLKESSWRNLDMTEEGLSW